MTYKQKISIVTFIISILFSVQYTYSQNSWALNQFNEAILLHKKAMKLHNLYNEKSTKYRLSCNCLDESATINSLYKKARKKYKEAYQKESFQNRPNESLLENCKINIKAVTINFDRRIKMYTDIYDSCERSKKMSVNAFSKIRSSAEEQYNLGRRYYYGEGTVKDHKKAFYLFKNSAERGYAGAQYMLGTCYHRGDGILKNQKKAFYWFKKSAEQGYKGAPFILGVSYFYGLGTSIDKKETKKWIKLAVENNSSGAEKFWNDKELWKY
ncbi:MAG: hypothetical protein COB60_12255 [Flavobacteriaceae bacterium]|nr:MAG: hypothetical protein COB60_12255 [Flavobacteriaceae bacterium]